MKTHSIRNKSKPTPILTLAAPLMGRMLGCYPEAVSLTLAWFCKRYKELTGKVIVLDHEQELMLLKHAGADPRGMWTSRFSTLGPVPFRIERAFADGMLLRMGGDMLELLEDAQAFYVMLERTYMADAVA